MSNSDNHQNGTVSDVWEKDSEKVEESTPESLQLIESGKYNGNQHIDFNESGIIVNRYETNESGKIDSA